MPPPGSNKKKSKKGKDKKAKRDGGGSRGVGGGSAIDNLIESGNDHLAFERFEEGMRDLKRACSLAPENADAAEAYGMALAEFGDAAEAISTLKRAAQVRLPLPPRVPVPTAADRPEENRANAPPPLARADPRHSPHPSPLSPPSSSLTPQLRPNEGYEKFMYLGQLLDDGVAAATCTRQGLAIIEFQAAHGDADAEDRMCGACCALAEQLLATADDVEDVAEECDSLLRRASEADPSSAEPLQVMASLRSQQGRSEEALEALRQSIAQWRSRRGGRDVDPDAEDGEDMAEEHMGEYDVSFEFRFETAKLLLELDENTDEAIDVLEELLNERDDVVDVWHLLALANHGCCNFDKALELLNHAEQLNESQGGDEGVVADLMELRAAVTESKEKWNEEVGEDHRAGGEDSD